IELVGLYKLSRKVLAKEIGRPASKARNAGITVVAPQIDQKFSSFSHRNAQIAPNVVLPGIGVVSEPAFPLLVPVKEIIDRTQTRPKVQPINLSAIGGAFVTDMTDRGTGIGGALGQDVDDTAHGIGPVERRYAAAHDFDMVNLFNGDFGKIRSS